MLSKIRRRLEKPKTLAIIASLASVGSLLSLIFDFVVLDGFQFFSTPLAVITLTIGVNVLIALHQPTTTEKA